MRKLKAGLVNQNLRQWRYNRPKWSKGAESRCDRAISRFIHLIVWAGLYVGCVCVMRAPLSDGGKEVGDVYVQHPWRIFVGLGWLGIRRRFMVVVPPKLVERFL